ncbi:MAG: replicative DNA helicase, partial [Chloroflexota bacterium]
RRNRQENRRVNQHRTENGAFLQPDDFFILRHRYIWEAFGHISLRGEPIERQTVRRQLQDMDFYEAVGGDVYLSELTNSTSSAIYAEHYAQLVERDAVRRRLLIASDEIRGIATDRDKSLEEVIGDAESKLFAVSERRTQRDVVSMREATSRYFERIEQMMQSQQRGLGLPTGFKKLDALLGGLQRSDLLIFAGRPGMGKTSFMLSLALNAAQQFGARILVFSLEMGVEQMVQRMVSMETGINMQRLRTGQFEQHEQRLLVEALGRLSTQRIFLDDSPSLNPIQMRTKCQRIKHEHGLDLVVLDYMQLMHAPGFTNNRVQEISYISRHMKELAREMNVPLLSAAQLSRAVEQRADKRPQLSDLRESGCLTGESLVWLPDAGRYERMDALCGQSGFRVMSLNPDTYKLEAATVTNAFSTGVKPVFKLQTAPGRSVRATANHKFLTIEGWKRLDELVIGERIATPADRAGSVPAQALTMAVGTHNGASAMKTTILPTDVTWAAITAIEHDGEEAVYDLTVPAHSNFVCNNIVVHNSIEQDADIVMFLYRDIVYNEATEYPNQADVIVAKHRNGPTDVIPLYFDSTITRFMDGTRQSVDLSTM